MTRLKNVIRTAQLAVLFTLVTAYPAVAQDPVTWNVPLGSYSEAANWMHMFGVLLPDSTFDEIAVVGNGGTAFVEDTPPLFPAGLTINAGSTVEIREGGNLMVVLGDLGLSFGHTAVNNGRLIVLPGGSFSSESLAAGTAGAIDLSGTASFTVNGDTQLAGMTRIAGPDVDFSTDSLTATGTISAMITGQTHSAINVSGDATIGGNLVLDFDESLMPEFGDTWDIVDAQSITGGFGNVTANISAGPGLVFGSEVATVGNSQVARAVLEPRLTLEINRRTGQTQIRDITAIEATTIDGYSVGSPNGTFAPGEWNQFGLANWVPSEADATHVGEISLTSQREIAAGQAIDLGNLYANPGRAAGFGVTMEDATFEYSVEGGEVLTGLINYTDAHNNVVLVVDPDTGDTWIQNQSLFDVQLDGYDIESDAGSLDPGQWVSFASEDDAWTEANPADYHIGELNFSDSMLLPGEGEAISLGKIFTPGGERDLAFTFNTAAAGGQEPMTWVGVVEYDDGTIDFGPGGGGVPGDYNNNGLVEQADLDLVLVNWGQDIVPPTWTNDLPEGFIDQAELDGVLTNWGSMGGQNLAAAAVPEPAGFVLGAICLSLLAMKRPRATLRRR